MKIDDRLKDLRDGFEIDAERIIEIAKLFKLAMENGLRSEESPLKMLPSYIGRPTGLESGVFYTFDMGGTNIRSAKYELNKGQYAKLAEVKSKLKNAEEKYDYTTEQTNAEELFDFFAELISKVADKDQTGYLGHTFSFPVRQSEINEAILIEWTKEINVAGVIGQNPNKLLAEALLRQNLRVKPIALINDTVATLLVGAYTFKDADVGTIIGTGYNSCYLESDYHARSKEMIINMETGNFNRGLPVSKYDRHVDKYSINPGRQSLEKMVSGSYIGRVVEQVIRDHHDNHGLLGSSNESMGILGRNRIDSLMTAEFIQYPDRTAELLNCPMEDALLIKDIARIVVRRAIRLAAATYIGTLMHIDDGEINNKHVMTVDGALYEKMPDAAELFDEAIEEVLGSRSELVRVKFLKDGSGVGAAIAAAIAIKS